MIAAFPHGFYGNTGVEVGPKLLNWSLHIIHDNSMLKWRQLGTPAKVQSFKSIDLKLESQLDSLQSTSRICFRMKGSLGQKKQLVQ